MPKWGLTADQRKSKPWGLSPEILEPAKTITDPIQGDIYLSSLEVKFLDTPPMQRLRRVRQLGTTHLVYPGATHNRFAHSIGTLRAAQNLLDAVLTQRYGPHPANDLFEEWDSGTKDDYDRKVAEATVLTRLGALLHDICHVPFGHSIEDDLFVLRPHDSNIERFEILWELIPKDITDLISPELNLALRHIILPGEPLPTEEKDLAIIKKYPFVADIVGNTICADLLDYLERDHEFMGLPAKLGHRFIDGFYVTRSDALYHPQRMAIQIVRNSRLRADVVTELFKFLRYRYELTERGLVHHAKLAADAMIGKALEMWNDTLITEKAIALKPELAKRKHTDIDELINELQRSDLELLSTAQLNAIRELEHNLITRGDDGLLEYMVEWGERNATKDSRKAGIAHIARSLLERKLYKLAGRSESASRSLASEIFHKYGGFEARRLLEKEVASYVGLDHKWHVVLWIPSPEMRLKAADVLIDTEGQVLPLKDFDRTTMQRGKDIYESHEALWALSVYVHPELSKDELKKRAILAWLHERLGINWSTSLGFPSLGELAAEHVANIMKLSTHEQRQLEVSLSGYKGEEDTFEALCQRAQTVADSWGIQTTRDSAEKIEPSEPERLL